MNRAPKPWLIIPVEVQARELLAKLLLAHLAVKRGYNVVLGKDTIIRRLAGYLPKGVIYDKSLGLARHGKPQRFKRLGHNIAIMDEESTGFYGSPERFLGVRLSDETLNCAQTWFCISDQLRQQAIKEYPKHAKRFVVSGLPRTDTWRPQLHLLYENQVATIKQRHGDYILFCSNFGGIVHARGEAFVRKQLKGQSGAYAKTEEESEQIFHQGRQNLDAFVAALPQIKKWFPKHKLIVRPHPSESLEFWQNAVGGIDQCEVIAEGAASPWILGSSCLLHHGCTTGIEAEIMGKSHIMYAPFRDDHHDTKVMEAFAPIVKTMDDLKRSMSAMVSGNTKARDNMKDKEQFFAQLEGKLSSEAILDEIDTYKLSPSPFPAWFAATQFTPRMLMANVKPRSHKSKTYANQKWQGTTVAELGDTLSKINTALGDQTDVLIEQKIPDLFVIQSKD